MVIMADVTDEKIKRALVALAIEKALLDIGKTTFEEVGKTLYSRYQVYFPDCYEHPEFLNAVLKDLYGKSFSTIVDSIRKQLGEFASKKPIAEFLVKISE